MYTTSYIVSFNFPKKGENGEALAVIGRKGLGQVPEVTYSVSGIDALRLYKAMTGQDFNLFSVKI